MMVKPISWRENPVLTASNNTSTVRVWLLLHPSSWNLVRGSFLFLKQMILALILNYRASTRHSLELSQLHRVIWVRWRSKLNIFPIMKLMELFLYSSLFGWTLLSSLTRLKANNLHANLRKLSNFSSTWFHAHHQSRRKV